MHLYLEGQTQNDQGSRYFYTSLFHKQNRNARPDESSVKR